MWTPAKAIDNLCWNELSLKSSLCLAPTQQAVIFHCRRAAAHPRAQTINLRPDVTTHRVSGYARLIPWRITNPFSINRAALIALKVQVVPLKLRHRWQVSAKTFHALVSCQQVTVCSCQKMIDARSFW